MRWYPLEASPPGIPGDTDEALLVRPELGLCGIVAAQASLAPLALVVEAARRGGAAWDPERDGGATLRGWVQRIASAVRQAGEACQKGGFDAARRAGDGSEFVPDPSLHAFAFCLEGAFVRVADGAAEVAAIGRCAVVRWRRSGLEPLHALHTLAAVQPPENAFYPEGAHDITTSALAHDPKRLLGDLTELRLDLATDEMLVLLSPALATRVVGRRLVPSSALTETPDGLLAGLASLLPASEHARAALVSR